MSSRDHRVTLKQIEEYARHAQDICAGKTLRELLADWQATLADDVQVAESDEDKPGMILDYDEERMTRELSSSPCC